MDNVTQILNKIRVSGDKWEEMIHVGGLNIPEPLLKEIQMRYSTNTEKNHACADYYVNCHPNASLEDLSSWLYGQGEFAALKEKKSLASTGKVIMMIILLL